MLHCATAFWKKMDVAQNPHQIQPRQTKDFPTSVIETRKLKDDENGFMTFGRRGTETVKWLGGKG